MNKNKHLSALFVSLLTLAMVYCGDDAATTDPEPKPTYTVSGNISGLAGELELDLIVDGQVFDTITLTEDGSFTFEKEVEDGSDYEIDPGNLSDCPSYSATAGSGTIEGANITNIVVECN